MEALHEDEAKMKHKADKGKYETEISRVYKTKQKIYVMN